MRTLHALLLFTPLLFLTASCEQIAELTGDLTLDAPEVTYSKTTYEADFYTAGSSSAPSIDWNGDQGTITLGSTIEGLDINTSTGKLEWTKLLPPGTHEVDVVVANSEGQVVVPITIENPLQGSFVGTYSGSSYYSFDLLPDGTMTFANNSATSPDIGEGTWTLDGDEMIGNYVYDIDPTAAYSFKGTLEQTTTKVTVIGSWYSGVYADTKTPYGEFELELE